MHYYKRNLGDYAKKAGRLSMLQHGAYNLLIDACYDREKFPTLEEAIDWTWASTEAEIEAVKFVLSRFFRLDADGQYVQDRILEEILDYSAKSEKNKRIAQEREAKRNETYTKRERLVDESSQKEQLWSPNQEPRTNNQEPLTKETTSLVDTPPANRPPASPNAEIVELYHKHLPMCPRVEVLNDGRKRAIASRWREVVTDKEIACKADPKAEALAFFSWFFEHASKSHFLTGRLKAWRADFDFLMTPSKFVKVVEGHYHGDKK